MVTPQLHADSGRQNATTVENWTSQKRMSEKDTEANNQAPRKSISQIHSSKKQGDY